MKTIAKVESQFCEYQIIKIQNGYLIQVVGISESNQGYKDCVYNQGRQETFNQFMFLTRLGGLQLKWDFEQIEW